MLHFKQIIPSFKECFSAFDIPTEKVLFFDSDLFALPRLFEGDFTVEKLDLLCEQNQEEKSSCLCKFRPNTKSHLLF